MRILYNIINNLNTAFCDHYNSYAIFEDFIQNSLRVFFFIFMYENFLISFSFK